MSNHQAVTATMELQLDYAKVPLAWPIPPWHVPPGPAVRNGPDLFQLDGDPQLLIKAHPGGAVSEIRTTLLQAGMAGMASYSPHFLLAKLSHGRDGLAIPYKKKPRRKSEPLYLYAIPGVDTT